MRFKLLGIAAGGLMIALAPAAASAAEIDCIVERTPVPLKAEVETIAAKVIADSEGTPGGEAAIAGKLDGQRASCAGTYRWGQAKSKAAMDYTIATLLRGVVQRGIASHDISLAAVDGVISANPAVFNPQPGATASSAARNKVIADARAAGLPMDEPELAEMLLTYFGAVAVCNQIRLEFEAA